MNFPQEEEQQKDETGRRAHTPKYMSCQKGIVLTSAQHNFYAQLKPSDTPIAHNVANLDLRFFVFHKYPMQKTPSSTVM